MNKHRQVGIIMSLIVSAVMGFVAAFLVIHTNPDSLKAHSALTIYLMNIILSVILGVILGAFFPFGKMGMALAKKANATPPSLKFILINAIPISLGNTLLISLFLSYIGVLSARTSLPPEVLSQLPPLPLMWITSWGKLFFPTLLISYILSVVLAPVVTKLVGFKKPETPPEVNKDKET